MLLRQRVASNSKPIAAATAVQANQADQFEALVFPVRPPVSGDPRQEAAAAVPAPADQASRDLLAAFRDRKDA